MTALLRRIPAFAALVCGFSVALGAYASHAASGQARERIALAALFAFAHGLALIVMAPRTTRLAGFAKVSFVAGIVLFSGSLASAGLFGSATGAAPFGGSLLMLGWLLAAAEYWRKG